MPSILITIIIAILMTMVIMLVYSKPNILSQAEKLMADKEYEQAITLLEGEIKKNPDSPDLYYCYAKSYEFLGEYENALKNYEKVKKLFLLSNLTDIQSILRKIGDINSTLNNYDLAFEAYLQILSIDPSDYYANSHVGFMAIGQKEFNIAKPFLAKATTSDPSQKQTNLAYAISLHETNDPKVIEVFESLVKNDSSDENNLLYIMALIKANMDEALPKAKEYLVKLDDEHLQKVLLRWALFNLSQQQMIAKTISFLEELLTLNKVVASLKKEIQYYLILFYLRKDSLLKAKPYIDLLEQEDPNYREVKTLSAFLEKASTQLEELPKDDIVAIHNDTINNLIPPDILFKITNLETANVINFDRYFDIMEGSVKIKNKFRPLTQESFRKEYLSMPASEFFNFVEFLIKYNKFEQIETAAELENDLVFHIVQNKKDETEKVLIAVTRWKEESKFSDIFIENCVSIKDKYIVNRIIIFSNTEVSEVATEKLKKYEFLELKGKDDLLKIYQIFKLYATKK